MELTKNQIQFIDHRLENEGVEYWDIRIEMLDHVILDVEKKLSVAHSNYQFEKLVQESFENLGWKENFNGSSFESVLKEKYKILGKNNRKVFNKEFLTFFRNIHFLILSCLLIACYYFVSMFFSHKNFILFSYILFFIPIIIFIYEYVKLWRKKIGKSFFKNQSLTFLWASCALFHVFMISMKPQGQDFAIPVLYQKPTLFIIIPIHMIFSFINFKAYKKTIVEVINIRKQLLS